MKIKSTWVLIVSILIAQCAGIVGSVFTMPAITSWYAEITKPAFSPPNWIFGPVWTTLFVLMGIAAYLVWERTGSGKNKKQIVRDRSVALTVYGVQLVLNTLWSLIFFGLQSPGAAFVEIVVLWLAIVATMYAFSRVSRVATWLLVPYILWVSFASFLNYTIWQLNAGTREVACTQEAMVCPDGTAVGRTGADCAFAPC